MDVLLSALSPEFERGPSPVPPPDPPAAVGDEGPLPPLSRDGDGTSETPRVRIVYREVPGSGDTRRSTRKRYATSYAGYDEDEMAGAGDEGGAARYIANPKDFKKGRLVKGPGEETFMENTYKTGPRAGQKYTTYRGGPVKSKYTGVSPAQFGKGWTATIKQEGSAEWLGRFDTEEEAARAYDARAREYGRRCNFPNKRKDKRFMKPPRTPQGGAFPAKLCAIINDPANEKVVRWDPKDLTFSILDRNTFIIEVLPAHFTTRHTKEKTAIKTRQRGAYCDLMADKRFEHPDLAGYEGPLILMFESFAKQMNNYGFHKRKKGVDAFTITGDIRDYEYYDRLTIPTS